MATTPRKSTSARTPAAVLSVRLSDSDGPVQLTPDGLFRARDGRPAQLPGWRLGPGIAARLLARLRARRTPIVVDYEHQTLLADRNGQPAPAAGWIEPDAVEYRAGSGLWAPVRWTARAKAHIDAGEYAFLSPVLPYDPAGGEILDLVHVALTNYPAVDGMAPVAALSARFDLDSPPAEEARVEKTKLIELLGLAADADDNKIEAALVALKADADLAQAVRRQLVLAADAPAAAALAALAALKSGGAAADPALWVPRAVYDETTRALAALKSGSDSAELEQLLQAGLGDGRIPGKATADWLRAQGVAVLKAYLEGASPAAALKATQTGGKSPADPGPEAQTEEDLAVCVQMGVDPAEFLATRKREATV